MSIVKVAVKKLFAPNHLHVKMKEFINPRDRSIDQSLMRYNYVAMCELDGFTDLFYRPTYVEWKVNTTCPHCKKAIALRRLEGKVLPR